jgi:hypothetical protein
MLCGSQRKPINMSSQIQIIPDGKISHRAALLFGSPERRSKLQQMADELGCSVSDGHWIAQNAVQQDSAPKFDLLLINLLSISERPVQELSNIASYLEASGASALIWTDMEGLEMVYAIMPVYQCHFLVGASDIEAMLVMSGAIQRGKMEQLHDNSVEGEFSALHRISDELANFARTLARIAEHDEEPPKGLAERPVSFRAAPTNMIQPFMEANATVVPRITANFIRETIKLRRMRDNHFNADLFADPAWDILLDLLAARLEGKSVAVSSLCIAAAVPATTALRWITGMTENGMLLRRMDPKDARRVFIELSEDVAEKLVAYFSDIRKRSGAAI